MHRTEPPSPCIATVAEDRVVIARPNGVVLTVWHDNSRCYSFPTPGGRSVLTYRRDGSIIHEVLECTEPHTCGACEQ